LKSENFKDCVDLWDFNYIGENFTLINSLVLAANYMDIKPLLELGCAKIACMIRGLTTESIKKEFEINSPLTKEEEELFLADRNYLELNL